MLRPGREVEDVVLVDRRRDEQQRHLAHLAVVGLYWISSKTSVRSTTEPGETARLTPTSKLSVSTLCGQARRPRDVARRSGGRRGRGWRRPRRRSPAARPGWTTGSSSARARRGRCSRRSAPGARSASRAARRRSRRRRSRRPRGSPASRGAAASCAPTPGRRSAGRPWRARAPSARRRRARARSRAPRPGARPSRVAGDSGTDGGDGARLDEAAGATPDGGVGEQDVESCLAPRRGRRWSRVWVWRCRCRGPWASEVSSSYAAGT